MTRKQNRPVATRQCTLDVLHTSCRVCGSQLLVARYSHRKVTRLDGVFSLTIKVYQCPKCWCVILGQKLSPERNHLVRFEFLLRESRAIRVSSSDQLPKIRQKVVMQVNTINDDI